MTASFAIVNEDEPVTSPECDAFVTFAVFTVTAFSMLSRFTACVTDIRPTLVASVLGYVFLAVLD